MLTDVNRPRMPTAEDQARAEHLHARLSILLEDWEETLRAWLIEQLGETRASVIGVVDTSVSTINDLCRQLSTPGLYGKPWRVSHSQQPVDDLVGPDGLMGAAGYYAVMAWVQYLTLGLGDVFVDWTLTPDRKGLYLRLVMPHNVYQEPDPYDDTRVISIWELRAESDGYVWHVHGADGLRVYRALSATVSVDPLAGPRAHLGEELAERRADPLVGLDGRVELPLVRYCDAETKQRWNSYHRRGAHRGALNAALFWTYAGYCARDATAAWVAVWGLEPAGAEIVTTESGETIQRKLLVPGTVEYHKLQEGFTGQPGITQISAGANLPEVSGYADKYEMKQAVRYGLNPSDLSRTNNPTSAAALMVSNEGKREFAAQVTAVFRAADRRSIRVAAIVARQAGLGSWPEQGYTVDYVPIPLSAAERQAIREQLDYELQHGLIGPIEHYRRLHPTIDEAGAVAALVAAAREARTLDAAMRSAGLVEVATGAAEDVQAAAMNGAQIESLINALIKVARGELPREAGLELAAIAYPSVPQARIDKLFEKLRGFTPATPTNTEVP